MTHAIVNMMDIDPNESEARALIDGLASEAQAKGGYLHVEVRRVADDAAHERGETITEVAASKRSDGATPDSFGRVWPEGYELCATCGQPDNCGDCTHVKLGVDDVRALGGTTEVPRAETEAMLRSQAEQEGIPQADALEGIPRPETEDRMAYFTVEIAERVGEGDPSPEAADVEAWLRAGMGATSTFGEQIIGMRVVSA